MAERVDLNGILENIQTTLQAANTTTASPIDLSSDLSRRVRKILKVHPLMIPVQASFYPFVTCYVSKKSPQNASIAKDQLNAKRRAEVFVDVVAAVWNDTLSVVDEDPADKDINYLMENVELVLRSIPNVSGSVLWQVASDTLYYDQPLKENVHLRAGIMTIRGTVFY